MNAGRVKTLIGGTLVCFLIMFAWTVAGKINSSLAAVVDDELIASSETFMIPNTSAVGSVDLSDWNFDLDGSVELREGWSVLRNALVDPGDFSGTGCQLANGVAHLTPVSIPDVWGPGLTSTVETGHGVATYCLELQTGRTDKFLALRLGTLRSVSMIYASYAGGDGAYTNTEILYRNGDPVLTPRKDGGNPATPVIQLPREVEDIRLIIQLANYVHKQGGMTDVPVLDYQTRLESRYRRDGALPTALVLILLLTSVGTLVVGMYHTDTKRYIIFALLSFASALRVLFVSDVVWDYFPSFSLARKYDLEYLSLFLLLPAYYAFIRMLFRPGVLSLFDMFVYSVTGLLAVFTLVAAPFFAPGTVTLLREPYQVLWVIIGLVVAFTILKALLAEGRSKLDAALVLTAAASMSIYEALSGFGVIPYSMEWSQVMVLFVTLLHVRAFQSNFKQVELERDQLNSNLLTANKNLEAQTLDLKQALVRAEDASRSKNEFLAVMSHELRTPLNAIIGFSEMMSMQMFGPLGDERYKSYTDDISGSGKHLLSIVNDILDLSRIESGKDEMFEEEIEPALLGQAIIRLVAAQGSEGGITCHFEDPGNTPLLFADNRKVKQILINLMSNAIKFNNPGGSAHLTIRCEEGHFVLSVRDSGIGMRMEDVPTALMRFRQIDGDLSRKYEGLGLGLSLVQKLAEQHGADLEIESELGKGTTVTVTFPKSRSIQATVEAV